MLTLMAYPRLHFTLIDLGHATARIFGGIGMAIDAYPIKLSFSESQTLEVDLKGFDSTSANDVQRVIRSYSSASGKVVSGRLVAQNGSYQHCGFGSKTALLLGTVALLDHALSSNLSRSEIQRLSGRGGASAIGLQTFFDGGVVVDCGQRRYEGQVFNPSSAGAPATLPIPILRCEFPRSWQVHLLLPFGRKFYGGREVEFFRQSTPVPNDEILAVLANVYHGAIPAILEQDLDGLKRACLGIRQAGFKRREIDSAGEVVKSLIERLESRTDAAVGMSSLGPLIYAITRADDHATTSLIAEIANASTLEFFAITAGRNEGYELSRGTE